MAAAVSPLSRQFMDPPYSPQVNEYYPMQVNEYYPMYPGPVPVYNPDDDDKYDDMPALVYANARDNDDNLPALVGNHNIGDYQDPFDLKLDSFYTSTDSIYTSIPAVFFWVS
jgi:hypothetical protein